MQDMKLSSITLFSMHVGGVSRMSANKTLFRRIRQNWIKMTTFMQEVIDLSDVPRRTDVPICTNMTRCFLKNWNIQISKIFVFFPFTCDIACVLHIWTSHIFHNPTRSLITVQPSWPSHREGAGRRHNSLPCFWIRRSLRHHAPGLAQGGLQSSRMGNFWLRQAMNMLGLNPNEQEVIDIPNHVARQNTIYINIIWSWKLWT